MRNDWNPHTSRVGMCSHFGKLVDVPTKAHHALTPPPPTWLRLRKLNVNLECPAETPQGNSDRIASPISRRRVSEQPGEGFTVSPRCLLCQSRRLGRRDAFPWRHPVPVSLGNSCFTQRGAESSFLSQPRASSLLPTGSQVALKSPDHRVLAERVHAGGLSERPVRGAPASVSPARLHPDCGGQCQGQGRLPHPPARGSAWWVSASHSAPCSSCSFWICASWTLAA